MTLPILNVLFINYLYCSGVVPSGCNYFVENNFFASTLCVCSYVMCVFTSMLRVCSHVMCVFLAPCCVFAVMYSVRVFRTKALVLELLAAVCLVSGGHDIILSAFDNLKEVGFVFSFVFTP